MHIQAAPPSAVCRGGLRKRLHQIRLGLPTRACVRFIVWPFLTLLSGEVCRGEGRGKLPWCPRPDQLYELWSGFTWAPGPCDAGAGGSIMRRSRLQPATSAVVTVASSHDAPGLPAASIRHLCGTLHHVCTHTSPTNEFWN